MRKFLLLIACALVVAAAVVCARPAPVPKYSYYLTIDGGSYVADTQMGADLDIVLHNVELDEIVLMAPEDGEVPPSFTTDPRAVEWLNSYIQHTIIARFKPSAVYSVHVGGMVVDSRNNTAFMVDKEFTNSRVCTR